VGVWWHDDGARGMGRRDGGAGVGRIAETRWRGVTGSGRRWVGLGQATFIGLIGGIWKIEWEIIGVYCVRDDS
jgi:hypothetical protein